METIILSRDLAGELTLLAPGFEPTTFMSKFLSAADIPILMVEGLLMLSPQNGPSQVASAQGAI